MNHRKKSRFRASLIVAASLAGLLTACGTREPPPELNAAPTQREWAILGVDATDSYFLTRFRRCVQWKSEQMCKEEPYGDDEGGFH